MTELQQYIGAYFDFDKLAAEKVSEKFNTVYLKKGDYLCQTDSHCTKMGFVQSGALRMYVNEDNSEVTQWISTKGEFATELSSFMFYTPARWNIQAISDCEIHIISRDSYNRIGDDVKEWPELERLFLAKCFVTLENRVYSFLSKSAEERYQELFDSKKELFNEIPLQYLASMLGMSPETMSRIWKKTIS